MQDNFIGSRINTGLPSNIQEVREEEEANLPKFSTVLCIILVPLVLVAFLIAALIRASVGAAVVAMTMAAGIMAAMPGVAELSPVYLAAMVCAINGGATAFSHVNDSGFWLVSSLLEIDEKTTLKSWTMMETIIGVTGLICAIVISLFAQRRTEIRGIPSLPDKLVERVFFYCEKMESSLKQKITKTNGKELPL